MFGQDRKITILEIAVACGVILLLLLVTIPKFLDAQFLVKLVKVQKDFAELEQALLAYHKDHHAYFQWQGSNPHSELAPLTTPVAYIERIPEDPFRGPDTPYRSTTRNYDYSNYELHDWVLASLGPDGDEDLSGVMVAPPGVSEERQLRSYHLSNGVDSSGDLAHMSWSEMLESY
ncbi:MAG: hypothetical protein ABIH23_22655 [bacterium]